MKCLILTVDLLSQPGGRPRPRLRPPLCLQKMRFGDDLVRAVHEIFWKAADLSTTAKETIIHEHIRRSGALGAGELQPGRPTVAAHVQSSDGPKTLEVLTAP